MTTNSPNPVDGDVEALIYYILLSALISLIFCAVNKDKRIPSLPNFFLWMITWPLNLLYIFIVLLGSSFVVIYSKYRMEKLVKKFKFKGERYEK